MVDKPQQCPWFSTVKFCCTLFRAGVCLRVEEATGVCTDAEGVYSRRLAVSACWGNTACHKLYPDKPSTWSAEETTRKSGKLIL